MFKNTTFSVLNILDSGGFVKPVRLRRENPDKSLLGFVGIKNFRFWINYLEVAARQWFNKTNY